jgi:Transposase DDE domain group 1
VKKKQDQPAGAECQQEEFHFAPVKGRKVSAAFTGAAVTSDAGVQLLRAADRKLGLLGTVARVWRDRRNPDLIVHELVDLLRQRVYGLCAGYEDLNDHAHLRTDPCWQSAVEREDELASAPTLCRLENAFSRADAVAVNTLLVEQFIGSFATPPSELVLDFDATDIPLHGQQEKRFFHGYYDQHCYLPLYVFCGERLLVAYLRPADIDAARHAWAILALLVRRLRAAWPAVKIVLRADSGFCRHRMLDWCDAHDVGYVVGLAKNARLLALAAPHLAAARARHEETREDVRTFHWLEYGAQSWTKTRRVVHKAEHNAHGSNPRFVVTNLPEPSAAMIYDERYCPRGEAENRIKEQQLDLFGTRTSAHRFTANQGRILLSALAYTLWEGIRRLGLHGTALARARFGTLRLRLIKLGAVVLTNTRRVRLLLSAHAPQQALWRLCATRLMAAPD